MVVVDVDVPERVNELARLKTADLCDHHREQCVARDVERYTQEGVGAALVELAAQFSLGHIELEHGVTGRQCHAIYISRVPGGDDQSPAVRALLDHFHHVGDLVDHAAIGGVPAAPLVAIDWAKVAVGIGPFVPDAHAVVLEVLDVGIARQEPKQLVDDTLHVQLLSGHQGEAFAEVEAHLVTKNTSCSGSSAVGFQHYFFSYVLK